MGVNGTVLPIPEEDLDHIVSGTRGLWEEARGRRLFVTGGTGFFGFWILESFARANDTLSLGMEATVLSRNPDAFARRAPHIAHRGDIHFVKGDVTDFDFPRGEFPYVFHAATNVASKAVAPEANFDIVVSGTRRVLGFARHAGTEKLLFVSSGAVYGRTPAGMARIPETCNTAPDSMSPDSAYGLGKLLAEHLCASFAAGGGCAVKIARCFAFVGPHLPLDGHFAIGNFIRDALAGKPPQIKGDGTPRRSYLYMADLAVWLWTILFKGANCRPYNVGSDESLGIAEIAAATSAALGAPPPLMPPPGKPVSHYIPDITRARTELGLGAHYSLAQGIRKTAAWASGRPYSSGETT